MSPVNAFFRWLESRLARHRAERETAEEAAVLRAFDRAARTTATMAVLRMEAIVQLSELSPSTAVKAVNRMVARRELYRDRQGLGLYSRSPMPWDAERPGFLP
jgi:hypothetical protein